MFLGDEACTYGLAESIFIPFRNWLIRQYFISLCYKEVINIYKKGDGNNSPRLGNISEVFIALCGV